MFDFIVVLKDEGGDPILFKVRALVLQDAAKRGLKKLEKYQGQAMIGDLCYIIDSDMNHWALEDETDDSKWLKKRW